MPILNPNTFEFISRSPAQTKRIGIRLGRLLKAEDLICLSGDLGAGKTTLVQGIASGWGTSDLVTSPTFVLVNNYRRPDGLEMNHLDAYRLSNALEAEELDMDYFLSRGPLLVEWAERISQALPEDNLWISMSWQGEQQRRLVVSPHGERFQKLFDKLKDLTFKGF